MRSIFIAHNYSDESFSAMSYYLARHLAATGWRVIFLSHQPRFSNPIHEKIGTGELEILSWKSPGRPGKLKDFMQVARLVLKYRPNAAIGHFIGGNILLPVTWILRFGNCRNFGYVHMILSSQHKVDGITKPSWKQNFQKFRKRLFFKIICHTVICPSEMAKRDIKEYLNIKNTHTLLNPLPDRFIPQQRGTPTIRICYLGRFHPTKGVIPFVKAFIIFMNQHPEANMVLHLAGTGVEEPEIKALIACHDSIIFEGKKEYAQVDVFLRKANFVVLPSIADNLPTVGLEALMNGVPLLISESTGLSEYLRDGIDCIKFNTDQNEILELLARLSKGENMETISQNARKTYQKLFSVEKYCAEFSGLLT